MKYSIYKACKRHIHTVDFGSGLKLEWVKNPNGGSLFHFSDGVKYWAMPYSWAMLSNIFGYNISLTLA
jgi:hypothetical protein